MLPAIVVVPREKFKEYGKNIKIGHLVYYESFLAIPVVTNLLLPSMKIIGRYILYHSFLICVD